MTEIDAEHFISEVKHRPVLWDVSHEFYNQRHSKLAAWEEVSANLYVDWADLSNYDKFGKVRDIQNRWKNIRDSYIRELKYEKKVQKGMAMPKKKYKYSHLLEFLHPGEKRKEKLSDQSSTDLEESPVKKEESKQLNIYFSDLKEDTESLPVESNHKNNKLKGNDNQRANRFKPNNDFSLKFNLQSDSSTLDSDCNHQTPGRETKRAKLNIVPKTLTPQTNCSMEVERGKNLSYQNSEPTNQPIQELYQVNSEYLSPSVEIHPGHTSLPLEHDDDKMFLLSLLPYFKKLNEERKLQARIEMSTLLQKMIYKKC